MSKETKTKPVIVVKIITGKAKLQTAINSISVKGKELEKLIHATSVSVLAHVDKHREVSLVNALIAACPDMVRKNALRDWFLAFGTITFDKETKLMVFSKKGKTNIKGATQNPFWMFKPEVEYTPFNLLEAITKIVDTADKKLEKGNRKDKIPTETLTVLRKLVA